MKWFESIRSGVRHPSTIGVTYVVQAYEINLHLCNFAIDPRSTRRTPLCGPVDTGNVQRLRGIFLII